eukprot:scaffold185925_cov18-Tisochrysis_lutea.AAC.1
MNLQPGLTQEAQVPITRPDPLEPAAGELFGYQMRIPVSNDLFTDLGATLVDDPQEDLLVSVCERRNIMTARKAMPWCCAFGISYMELDCVTHKKDASRLLLRILNVAYQCQNCLIAKTALLVSLEDTFESQVICQH